MLSYPVMTRLEAFSSLRDHAWLGRLYKKLTVEERRLATEFLTAHAEDIPADFEHALVRWGLDRQTTRHHGMIVELLSCSNTF